MPLTREGATIITGRTHRSSHGRRRRARFRQPIPARKSPRLPGALRRSAALVPRDWQAEPQNPNWNGKRFLSPDGTSWLAIYRASCSGRAHCRPHAEHHFRQGRNDHLSAGRADVGGRFRVSKTAAFFTAKLFSPAPARPGTTSPSSIRPSSKPKLDALVISAAQALDNTKSDCEQAVSATRP